MFLPFPKATLLVPSGPSNDPELKHLFILLTAPDHQQQVLMVGISSVPSQCNHDTACELFKGDHPFIKHNSYVRYRDAIIQESQKLIDGVKTGKLIAKEPLSANVMERVINGINTSKFLSPKIKAFYLANK